MRIREKHLHAFVLLEIFVAFGLGMIFREHRVKIYALALAFLPLALILEWLLGRRAERNWTARQNVEGEFTLRLFSANGKLAVADNVKLSNALMLSMRPGVDLVVTLVAKRCSIAALRLQASDIEGEFAKQPEIYADSGVILIADPEFFDSKSEKSIMEKLDSAERPLFDNGQPFFTFKDAFKRTRCAVFLPSAGDGAYPLLPNASFDFDPTNPDESR